MGFQSSGDDEEITGINITPMVDVLLVLLVIFMVTANYIVNKSIAVKLPTADTADNNSPNKNLAFVLDQNSQLFLDGQPLEWTDVAAKISKELDDSRGKSQNLQALISADEKTPHGTVVKLIDTVRKNGITDFAINVDASEEALDQGVSPKPNGETSPNSDSNPSPGQAKTPATR